MRVTDHRYARDLQRFDVALRMIRHEARTRTIRSCTGLTDDRIRKLYRTYVVSLPAADCVRRRRGKSPRQLAYFTRNAATHLEASMLAGILAATGLLDRDGAGVSAPVQLEVGNRLCDAYEVYGHFSGSRPLTFEHAWFLLTVLVRGRELWLSTCPVCAGAFIVDALAPVNTRCPLCRLRDLHFRRLHPRRRRRRKPLARD